jgi:2-polyprenyl-3-methyl-5-hydroxy-6-metoxy-1,4-benzoquinol methylase
MTANESVVPHQSRLDIADWNRIAEQYSTNDGYEDPTQNPMYRQLEAVLWESLGDLQGRNVLDLGCGHGWFSEIMHTAGARVLGIDGAERLIAHARSHYPGSEFVQADLAQGLPPLNRQFDHIVSTMVLMDIPDLTVLIRDVSKALTATGRFIFVILHPCFFQYKINFDEATQIWYRKVTNYQDPQTWRIESFGGHNHYHRNLTYYGELLRTNNLAITRLYEPELNVQPERENAHVVRQWPICLLVEARPMQIHDT